MNSFSAELRQWAGGWLQAWDRFWFTPAQPHTLALIRILAGSMLFYTHLVWTFYLDDFFGPHAWVPADLARELHRGTYTWSYLWYVQSPGMLWGLHILALLVFALLTIGLFTRVMAVLAWIITVAYCHRISTFFFGLDQVNAMLAMYLMLGPAGAVYSVDRWRAGRAGQGGGGPSTSANLAIRLMQLHLCVIYLFGGVSKMRGGMWWDGSAVWYAVANLEYRSLDMTWLVAYPWLVSFLAHLTVAWETFYCCLVWPRLTRPVVLLIAACVHGGIALFLGMITFGLTMLFANLAFVPPEVTQRAVRWLGGLRRQRAETAARRPAAAKVPPA